MTKLICLYKSNLILLSIQKQILLISLINILNGCGGGEAILIECSLHTNTWRNFQTLINILQDYTEDITVCSDRFFYD